MKKLLFSAFISICVVSWAQEPLVADAGNDSIFCSVVPDSFIIGGSPSAIGGNGNFIYTWDIYPKPYVPFPSAPNLMYYASDFLSDSTDSNPFLIRTLPSNERGPIIFILTLSDDSNGLAIDSVQFWYVSWTTLDGNAMIYTYPGDTQTISPQGFAGGFPPYTFDWGDSPNLIGERYDYNVYPEVYLPSRQVIVQDGPSPYWNGLAVTDSLGCTGSIGTYEGFIIEPLSVMDRYGKEKSTWAINGSTLSITGRENIESTRIFDMHGRMLRERLAVNSSSCEIEIKEHGFFVARVKYVSGEKEAFKFQILR